MLLLGSYELDNDAYINDKVNYFGWKILPFMQLYLVISSVSKLHQLNILIITLYFSRNAFKCDCIMLLQICSLSF